MRFIPERLIKIRENLGISKAQAAKQLNMSAMGYGRYERGEREPSFQTVSFIASTLGTTTDYLYGLTDSPVSDSITISAAEDPELFSLIQMIKKDDTQINRLLTYYQKLSSDKNKCD